MIENRLDFKKELVKNINYTHKNNYKSGSDTSSRTIVCF